MKSLLNNIMSDKSSVFIGNKLFFMKREIQKEGSNRELLNPFFKKNHLESKVLRKFEAFLFVPTP